jgi:thioredoxin reductase (NADPH)
VALVGRGNSAGQAVVFLAPKVKNLRLVVRGEGLEASMSQYLIERIGMLPNVELHTHTEVVALEGDEASGLTGETSATEEPGTRKPTRSAICFCSLAPIRMPSGSRIAFKSTTAASW